MKERDGQIVGSFQLKVEPNLDEIEQQLQRIVDLADQLNYKLVGIDLAKGNDQTFIRCPVCTLPVEVTSRNSAHEKVKLSAYCERCDATTDVILPPGSESQPDR